MACECCGVDAPTRKVVFLQVIGVVVIMFYQARSGRMCKSCIHEHFWKTTLTTAFLGWWGMISLVLTPFFLLNNIINYLIAMTLPAVPHDAPQASLTEEVIRQLEPYTDEMILRLNKGLDADDVIERTAKRARMSRVHVALYLQWLVNTAREEQEAEILEAQQAVAQEDAIVELQAEQKAMDQAYAAPDEEAQVPQLDGVAAAVPKA